MRMSVENFLNLKLMTIMTSVAKVSDVAYWCLVTDMSICTYLNKEPRPFLFTDLLQWCFVYCIQSTYDCSTNWAHNRGEAE